MTDTPTRKSPPPASRRGALIGLIAAVLLVLVGLLVVRVLGETGRLQDCALSGRTNCAPVDAEPPHSP
jgi:hypothetical protein